MTARSARKPSAKSSANPVSRSPVRARKAPAPEPRQQRQPAHTSELLLTVDDAARKLGIGRSLMYKLIWDGDVVSLTIGRFRRVAVAELTRYIQARMDAERAELLGRSA